MSGPWVEFGHKETWPEPNPLPFLFNAITPKQKYCIFPNTWNTLPNSLQGFQYNTLPKVIVPTILQELQQLAFKANSIALFQILPSYKKIQKKKKKKKRQKSKKKPTTQQVQSCSCVTSLELSFLSP